VSVSTQRDSEQALIAKEVRELREEPEAELAELAGLYVAKGLTPALALEVAEELTAHDALGAHAEAELGIDPHHFTNPWHAAWASMGAFTVGALLPLLAIVLPPVAWRVPVTVVAVVLALAGTGLVSARLGEADARRATVRVVVGGLLAMAVTYAIGALVGTRVG
jgi:VIT1/CCC1 family predicted Fe2+/Mn2+ transporter